MQNASVQTDFYVICKLSCKSAAFMCLSHTLLVWVNVALYPNPSSRTYPFPIKISPSLAFPHIYFHIICGVFSSPAVSLRPPTHIPFAWVFSYFLASANTLKLGSTYEKTQSLSFWAWVTSLSIMFSNSIHFPSKSLFLYSWIKVHCVYGLHFRYLPIT